MLELIEALLAVGPEEGFVVEGCDVLRCLFKVLSTTLLLVFLLAFAAVLVCSRLLEENEGGHGSRSVDKLLGIHI